MTAAAFAKSLRAQRERLKLKQETAARIPLGTRQR